MKDSLRTIRKRVRMLGDALKNLQSSHVARNPEPFSVEEVHSLVEEAFMEVRRRFPICITWNPILATRANIHELLSHAARLDKAGPVAQYLVGAKLQLRFRDLAIANDRFSAADDQTGRNGDFQLEDTAFHVTMSPMSAVYEKCAKNLQDGLRVYLLVPEDVVVGARQNARATAGVRIAVESIESFVANNLEELSGFSKDRLTGGFRDLLEMYNRRVDEIELDKSLLIEIPPSLG